MAKYELKLPKMGEGVIEATILNWVKKPGDEVSFDDTIVEIATDKVDSEVPSPVDGKLISTHFSENDVVAVGTVIAVIETDADVEQSIDPAPETLVQEEETTIPDIQEEINKGDESTEIPGNDKNEKNFKFYSPLVKSMAEKENISLTELENIRGSGHEGRLIKKDIETYLSNRKSEAIQKSEAAVSQVSKPTQASFSGVDNVEIIEMDRMRKLIADYMVESKRIAPHVTSMVEADVTNIFNWRKKNKDAFAAKYGQKLTFTPIFIKAIIQAIKDFPLINVSVDGSNIIVKKDINIGMAVALPSGNLIVPVIRKADLLSLAGLASAVNDLANRARNNELKPDEITGGTYTLTNLGSFGNTIGTPIINQPQVAIMATGAIKKKPVVIETPEGDVIGIRQMMYLSHAYDHRVVDGYLGGSFVRRVADYLEQFDINQSI